MDSSIYSFVVRRVLAGSKAILLPAAAFVALCAAAPSPQPSEAEPPDVAQLRAKMEVAAGPHRAMERIVATVEQNGRSKTRTSVRAGKNERITYQDGPFLALRGKFEGQAWHQNANGLTVLDQPRPGAEASERRTVALRHVTLPVVADVIDELNPKGDGKKTYVDPVTYRIVRVENVTPTETTVTTYDDFRTTAGHVDAWHEHSTDGHAENDRDERVVSIVASGVTAADVAVAAPRRALVSFPPGVTSVRLPATLDEQRHFIVRVTVGSRGLDFLLDTGSSGIVVDRGIANALGLKLYSVGSNAANAGRYGESEAIVPEMHVGTLAMKDVAVSVLPSSFASRSGTVQVVGLLGFDFIASLALSLDYEHGTVNAVDYDAFKPPSDPQALSVPIRVGDQGPETDVTIDGRLGERFEIDTGGVGGVMIADAFTRRYPGVTDGFRTTGGQVRLQGVGGEFTTAYYTIPEMRLGGSTFKNFSALVIGSDRLYAGDFDGVVGPDLLQYFTLTTDYGDSTIYLEPNSLGKRARSSIK